MSFLAPHPGFPEASRAFRVHGKAGSEPAAPGLHTAHPILHESKVQEDRAFVIVTCFWLSGTRFSCLNVLRRVRGSSHSQVKLLEKTCCLATGPRPGWVCRSLRPPCSRSRGARSARTASTCCREVTMTERLFVRLPPETLLTVRCGHGESRQARLPAPFDVVAVGSRGTQC